MDNLAKAELTHLNPPYCEIFKTRNTDLQYRSLGYGLRKKKKKKKDTVSCKVFSASCKRNKVKGTLLETIIETIL